MKGLLVTLFKINISRRATHHTSLSILKDLDLRSIPQLISIMVCIGACISFLLELERAFFLSHTTGQLKLSPQTSGL